jgi:site-specific recombinase XerD
MNQKPTLKTAYELFILECQSRRFTSNTLRFYRGRLSLFLRWCQQGEIVHLDSLTHHHIRQYLFEVQESGVSSAYHHGFARAIKTFLNYCVRDELLTVSPFKKVKMPQLEKKVLEAVDLRDVHTLLKACNYERDKAIFLFLLDSGVRASELCALNVEDVDFESGEVTVRRGKGQKGRTTFVGPRTRKQVVRYFIKERMNDQQDQEPLFTRQDNNGRIVYAGLRQMIRRIVQATGIKLSAHAFRRTFAINSLRNGMNIYMLAKLMGHTDITVLRAYLAITQDDLQAAHQQFGVVDSL